MPTVTPKIIVKLSGREMKGIGESLTDCTSAAMLSFIELEKRNTLKLKLKESIALVIPEHPNIPARCSPLVRSKSSLLDSMVFESPVCDLQTLFASQANLS